MAHTREASRSLTTQALWAAGGILATFLAIILIGLPIYVFPKTSTPAQTDAVFVLGPFWYQDRLTHAEELMDHGISDTLVISTPLEAGLPYLADACNEARPYQVICFTPDPSSTQGEAQKLEQLANQYGWNDVTVVTDTPHITRAKVIIQACFPGEIHMSSSSSDLTLFRWAYEYIYQTAGFIKVGFTSGC